MRPLRRRAAAGLPVLEPSGGRGGGGGGARLRSPPINLAKPLGNYSKTLVTRNSGGPGSKEKCLSYQNFMLSEELGTTGALKGPLTAFRVF